MRIIQGRKLKPFAVAKVLQEHEDRIAALEGDDPTPTPTPVTRDLSFTINDGTDPIEGATVTIGSKTGTTGSAGGCTISGVEEGTGISVEIAATGYTTKTETIDVDETHTSFTFSLVAASSP